MIGGVKERENGACLFLSKGWRVWRRQRHVSIYTKQCSFEDEWGMRSGGDEPRMQSRGKDTFFIIFGTCPCGYGKAWQNNSL